MAYEADILIVKGNHDEVDAANFIYSMAESLGKPAVINYSQGTHFGPHDGSTLEEQALNEILGARSGRVFVTAAGNEGGDFIHWGGFPLGADLWRFVAKRTGTVHVWSEGVLTAENQTVQLEVSDPQYRSSDNDYSVGIPGTAEGVITVGASTNAAVAGETAVEGALASFSSLGPTVDGRTKPDIVAPGENVLSSLSGDYQVESEKQTSDGWHYRESGTSMASPVTAGAIGLFLQRSPTASNADIKRLLASHALTDNHTSSAGSLPNSSWGSGKLDILAMLTNAGDAGGGTTPTFPTDPVARADFSDNGTVDFGDFVSFAGAFGAKTGDRGYDARIDLNDDGQIGFGDFISFAQLFGQSVGG